MTADLPIHQEVVLEEVEHTVRKLQGRVDPPFPGTVGDTLKEKVAASASNTAGQQAGWGPSEQEWLLPLPQKPQHIACPSAECQSEGPRESPRCGLTNKG